MRYPRPVLYCFAACLLLAWTALPGLGGQDPNSLGGFEISEEEFSAGVEVSDQQNVTLDSGTAYNGHKSLRITNPDGKGHAAAYVVPVNAEEHSVVLLVTAAIKVKDVAPGTLQWLSARCYVHGIDADDKPMGVDEIGLFHSGTRDWTNVQRLVLLPKGTKALKIVMSLAGKSGTAWFDGVQVTDKTLMLSKPESGNVLVSVEHDRVVGRLRQGIGWNWETVSPERYSEAEAATWDSLFARMDYDGTDWIRVGVGAGFYAPSDYEVGKDPGPNCDFLVDNRYTRQLCRLLEHCQKRGIPVLLCNWNVDGGYADIKNSQWLVTGAHDPNRRQNPDWQLPFSDQRFVDGLCALLKYLKVDRKFSCIKYVSIWNEPDGSWYYPEFSERFFGIYSLLDARLRVLGLRDHIRILGPESIEGGIAAAGMAQDVLRMGRFIDAAAVHDYTSGLPSPTETTSEFNNQRGADGYKEAIGILRKAGRGNVPIFTTELGSFGARVYTDSRMHYSCTLGTADYVIRCIKTGVQGFLRWQYNDLGDSQYEPFKLVDGRLTTDHSLYWGYSVLTRWTVPNSAVLRTRVTGGEDGFGIKRVEAVTLCAPDGSISILLVNSGRSPKHVTLKIGGKHIRNWRQFYYDSTLPSSIQEQPVQQAGESRLAIRVPAESINVITNCSVGLSGPALR